MISIKSHIACVTLCFTIWGAQACFVFGVSNNKEINESDNISAFSHLKNFQCKKCETLLRSKCIPSVFNCPSGGHHTWTDLGEVGENAYQCKKCSTLVRSKSTPSSFNCPSDGMHDWHKL